MMAIYEPLVNLDADAEIARHVFPGSCQYARSGQGSDKARFRVDCAFALEPAVAFYGAVNERRATRR